MKLFKYILSGVVGLSMAVSSYSSMLIDDFNTPDAGQVVALFPPGGAVSTGPLLSSVVGGSRNIILGTLDTPFSGTISVGLGTGVSVNYFGDGVGSLNNSIVSRAASRFEYNSFGTGLNQVVKPGEWFEFDYLVDQESFFRITLFSGLGVGPLVSATWTSPVISPGFGTVVSPTADVAFAGVDFTDVDQIWLSLVPTVNGGDIYVDNFSLIPESSTYLGVFSLGLVGFAAYRRFRKF